MDEIALPIAVEPSEWFVVFHTRSTSKPLSALACGRFKHVSAFGYYAGFKAWLVYDAQISGLRIPLISTDAAPAVLGAYTKNCVLVKFRRRDEPIGIAPTSRFGFYCVPAIKHLLGVRCLALRPDALYRHILRNGGVVIDGSAENPHRPEPRD
jgi:hypothetical protein